MASPVSVAPSYHGDADADAEAEADCPPSPKIQRNFYGSRPPSPSLFGRINLEKVNEKLMRERTESLEPPEIQARNAFDELIEVGGVPMRPWADCRPGDLADHLRGGDDGAQHIDDFYYRELFFWEDQLALWKRFGKRRALDGLPPLRDLSPIDAVAAFVAYLRGHLEMDMQNRTKPGRERWDHISQISTQRSLILRVLNLLPSVDAFLRRLRKEAGDETALDGPAATTRQLRREYKVPPGHISDDTLWLHRQSSLPPYGSEPSWSPKRLRMGPVDSEDEAEEEEEEWPSKRALTSPKPGPDLARSIRQKSRTNQSPVAQPHAGPDQPEPEPGRGSDASPPPEPTSSSKTRRSGPKPDNAPVTTTAKGATRGKQPGSTRRGQAAEKKTPPAKTKTAKASTKESAKRRQQKAAARGATPAAKDVHGVRRSARIAKKEA
ncbi:hypothetical protein C8A05DRAFT_36646 [Staphylotrichum tortipilum]|uniref:Uncharacterized protein n=1 Tax=Staphylotrichum tortipilum TaxID=2831512 RepID=A0AAN6RRF2_9PEZI|nr:hypothetical protein C8A05DRAFT_36646 [Staphylotrichum longicolle]